MSKIFLQHCNLQSVFLYYISYCISLIMIADFLFIIRYIDSPKNVENA